MKFYFIVRFIIAIFIFSLTTFAVLGIFYPVNFLDLQFVPLLQRIFVDFSFVVVVILALLLLLTMLWGRIYCSTICPLGILQELLLVVIMHIAHLLELLPERNMIMVMVH